jgi:hypothetical protein
MMRGIEMKKAFKLMGLFALVLSAMAFSATAAQAELNAKWKVNGADTTDALNVLAQAALEPIILKDAEGKITEDKHGILLTKTGLTKVEILCTSLKFVDALLKTLGGAKGKIHFDGCITKLNGGAAAGACKPHSPGAAEGLIETNALDGLIKLHETATKTKVDLFELLPEPVKFKDENGEELTKTPPFVTLIMGKEVGSECSIGSKFDITGKAFLKDAQEEGLVEKVTHLVVEGPLSALLFGGNAATIDGNANVFLGGGLPKEEGGKNVGGHEGLKFSGIAN